MIFGRVLRAKFVGVPVPGTLNGMGSTIVTYRSKKWTAWRMLRTRISNPSNFELARFFMRICS